MQISRRDFKKHEGPHHCGPAYLITAIEKRRSQWVVIERAFNASGYVFCGVTYPANTLQTSCIIGRYKTKALAIASALTKELK